MRTRRIEITFEKTERILTRRKRAGDRWCAVCGVMLPMLTPDEAATLAGVTPRTIYRWVETQRVHFTEVPDGALMICPKSLTGSDEGV